MPGYVIHLAVANEYKRKHKTEIKNYKEFIRGTIYPDNVKDKSLTHYGPTSSKPDLKEFLKEHNIDANDFEKGYFIHLVTDFLFYNKYLECFSKDIYNDYDILNKKLEEKYNVILLDEIKDKVFHKEGELKLLNLDTILEFIDKTSECDLKHIRNEVLNENKYWLEFRQLKHI